MSESRSEARRNSRLGAALSAQIPPTVHPYGRTRYLIHTYRKVTTYQSLHSRIGVPSTDDPEDADGPRYVTTFDPESGERASEAVVAAVAALVDANGTTLEPLYSVVEPEALDSLVEHARRVDDASTHRLRFTYEGFDVAVRSDGQIRIRDPSDTPNPDAE